MLKLIDSNIIKFTKSINDCFKSTVYLNFYSTIQPNNKSREYHQNSHMNQSNNGKIYHDQPKKLNMLEEKFEPNIFMNNLEMKNLTEQDIRNYENFNKKSFLYKLMTFQKIFWKNILEFLKTEMFFNEYLENDYAVENGQVDCFWEFKKKEDIKGWLIICDRDMDRGFSTVNLEVNKNGRLVFSGYLDCDNLPKDGIHEHTGFAHLSSPFRKTGFGLESYYNWSNFNHLVIRFRGDGRVYRILLRSASLQGAQSDSFYEYFLYTRGGPYWQIAKIPFSKFVLSYEGRYQEKTKPLMSSRIQSFSITLSKYTGPYRLEISHIGMQLDLRNNQDFDYETYFRPEVL